jgi:alanine dehydrogenase
MPGAVPHTSTYALTNATLPYIRSIANLGWHEALHRSPALALGLNTFAGSLTNSAVGTSVGIKAIDLETALAA